MQDLKGSKTEKNILTAFAGESQARNRYTYSAKQAKVDGFEKIAYVFEETANHEKEHAKRMFRWLKDGGPLEITWAYPAGMIGTTLENLRHAAAGEHEEHSVMYPGFAKVAEEEGFAGVADMFYTISVAEQYHEERYLALAETVEKATVFTREVEVTWRCRNCGYNHKGTDAPERCPACLHERAHFELLCECY